MAKRQQRFVCAECGHISSTWAGRCPSCQEWGSMVEDRPVVSRGKESGNSVIPRGIGEITIPERLSSGIGELDRVLGGGFVPGSSVLLGGEPGIGKSTLLLQACTAMAAKGMKVLYVSGEESLSQVAARAGRVGGRPGDGLGIISSANLDESLGSMDGHSIAVFDSVQSFTTEEGGSFPGTTTQVRAAAQKIMERCKAMDVPALIVGHITKQGSIAGPKLLEHMVDVVLLFAGDRSSPYRLLRSAKNRFGSTDELGVFEMTGKGLVPVQDPGRLFWSTAKEPVSGVAMGVILEGSRPFVAEIQALVAPTPFPYPKRTARGVDAGRLQLMLAVLDRRCGISSGSLDVFVNVAGGMTVKDPYSDLALCMAVGSASLDAPLPPDCCFIGEVGLAGEVRPALRTPLRLREAGRLGFRKGVISRYETDEMPEGIDVIRVGNLKEALRVVKK